MAVDVEGGAGEFGNVAEEAPDEGPELLGDGMADGVGDVHDGRPGRQDGADHFGEEVGLGAGRVLGAELHVAAEGARAADAFDGAAEDFALGEAELETAVDFAGGEEDVQEGAVAGGTQGPGGLVDVLGYAAGQGRHAGGAYGFGDAADGFGIARGGRREAGFDDVHPQFLELVRDGDLFGHAEACAGTLFAVAQGGVDDADPPRVFRAHGVH